MYYIYLYNDKHYKRTGMQYGYWSGKQYMHDQELFPVCSHTKGGKAYSSIKRANNGGWSAVEKFAYVTGFDIEDEKGNVVYQSHNDKIMQNFQAIKAKKEYEEIQMPVVELKKNEEKCPVCQVVEVGVGIELKLFFRGIQFYTHRNFETEDEAKEFAKEKGITVV